MTPSTLNSSGPWSSAQTSGKAENGSEASIEVSPEASSQYEGAMQKASSQEDANELASGSFARTVEGATSEGPAIPVDSLTLASQAVKLPPCPEEYAQFIENTSLERLVYWKLQGLFEKLEEDPPGNILKTILAHVERPLFALVLRKTKGNQSKAAEVLGCNRNTLHRKLKGFAIQPRDLRRALKIKDRKVISAADIDDELSSDASF